ncbi:MAG: hypothetical protein V3U16_02000 [Candidatus Neomarinimicrobiota bacterium]
MDSLPFSHVWLPYIYLYGMGGLLFFAGIFVTLRAKSFDLSRKSHQRWFFVLMFGFVWFLVMHGCWTLAAIGQTGLALTIVLVFVIAVLVIGIIFKSILTARS